MGAVYRIYKFSTLSNAKIGEGGYWFTTKC